MFRLKTLFLVALVLAALPAVAQAYSLTWDNHSAVGVTVTPTGGDLATKTTAGTGSLGVSGGVNGEIGIDQAILFGFDQAQYVNSLELSLLYTDGNYGDDGDEVAQITGFSGSQSFTYTLTADQATAGVYTGPGSLSNLSPATEGNGGLWSILNPFGGQAVDSILLTALDNEQAGSTQSPNSDFGFHAMQTTATPVPGSFLILGAGLLGVMAWRRVRN